MLNTINKIKMAQILGGVKVMVGDNDFTINLSDDDEKVIQSNNINVNDFLFELYKMGYARNWETLISEDATQDAEYTFVSILEGFLCGRIKKGAFLKGPSNILI